MGKTQRTKPQAFFDKGLSQSLHEKDSDFWADVV